LKNNINNSKYKKLFENELNKNYIRLLSAKINIIINQKKKEILK
jgi:hypothetical protein